MKRQIMYRCFDTLQGGKFEYWNPETDKYDGVFWTMIKNKSFKEPNLFTGLKDMAGKDIYDGDIIRYTEHEGYSLESFTAEIRYIKSYSCFGYRKLGLNEYGFDHIVIHPFSEHDEFEIDVNPYFEVIGNVYQNPELLVPKI